MKCENAVVEKYTYHRIRKPGRWNMGKETKHGSFYSHKLVIGGEKYSFIAQGWRQYVYKGDTCEFHWVDNNGYKNIDRDTLKVYDKGGTRVWRGYSPKNTPEHCMSTMYYGVPHIYDEYAHAREAISDLLGDSDDDSDWEESGGIDPALAPNHDWDHDPVGFR
jgi:hypothetical protein